MIECLRTAACLSDFLDAVGAPTGMTAIGTVNEIESHITSGKPAMIYFPTKPLYLTLLIRINTGE